MSELPFERLRPVHRKEGPSSSVEAATKLERSKRRRSQISALLERLRQGPATNVELAALCLKYTGRISDLRALGFDIQCTRQSEDGTTLYTLRREA